MKNKVKELLKDSLNVKICRVFILISFVFLVLIVWKWRIFPPELPLYYSLPRGSEQLGSPFEFLILPIFSTIIFVMHFLLAAFVNNFEKLASKLLLISALVTSLALLLTFIKIAFLIT